MKKYKALLVILIFFAVTLSFVRIVLSNSISTQGVFLDKLEEEMSYYKNQNLIYKEKILTLSSLGNVSSRANRLGFVDAKLGFVVGKSLPIAARQ